MNLEIFNLIRLDQDLQQKSRLKENKLKICFQRVL
jgi:hypothetical protein